MRLALAKLLLTRPDVLLLDEPTNHLDLESVTWLEGFLRAYDGAIVMVSHDRAFIDGLVDRVAEIENKRLTVYVGDYQAYEKARELALEQLKAKREAQDKEIAHMQVFVDRFRYKNTKAKAAQDRIRKIEKIKAELVELPEGRKTVRFRFPQPPRTGEMVISLEGVRKAYGDLVVYDGLDFSLYRGDKVALVGPNGAGKSTLLRMLAGVLEPDAGTRTLGTHVHTAYFAQHQLQALEPERDGVLGDRLGGTGVDAGRGARAARRVPVPRRRRRQEGEGPLRRREGAPGAREDARAAGAVALSGRADQPPRHQLE